jgi:GT2 family glycosyltransferase
MTPYRRQMLRYSGKDARALVLRKQDIFGPDGAAALYRRAMLEDIDLGQGVFDEDYFMHKEDVDVCWRAQLRGWRSIFVPNSVAYHIRTFRAGHRTHIDTNMRMLAIRNRYYLMTKNELPLLFIRDVLWIGMYDIAMFVYILCCEPKSVTAYRLFFESLSVLRMKRLLIQTRKRVGVRYMAQWFRWRYV